MTEILMSAWLFLFSWASFPEWRAPRHRRAQKGTGFGAPTKVSGYSAKAFIVFLVYVADKGTCIRRIYCVSVQEHTPLWQGRHGCRSSRQLLTSIPLSGPGSNECSCRLIWDNSFWHSAFPLQLT